MESARERKHGSRPQDWPLGHGTAFSVAAEKALGRQAAGPGRCLGATARGCARRRRAAPAAPRLCLGARSRRGVGSCGEPRAEARVPLTVGVTRVSGRLSRLPSFRRVFPLSGGRTLGRFPCVPPSTRNAAASRGTPAAPRCPPARRASADRAGGKTHNDVCRREGRSGEAAGSGEQSQRGREKEVERAAQPDESPSAEPGTPPGRGACASGQPPPLGACGPLEEPEEGSIVFSRRQNEFIGKTNVRIYALIFSGGFLPREGG